MILWSYDSRRFFTELLISGTIHKGDEKCEFDFVETAKRKYQAKPSALDEHKIKSLGRKLCLRACLCEGLCLQFAWTVQQHFCNLRQPNVAWLQTGGPAAVFVEHHHEQSYTFHNLRWIMPINLLVLHWVFLQKITWICCCPYGTLMVSDFFIPLIKKKKKNKDHCV